MMRFRLTLALLFAGVTISTWLFTSGIVQAAEPGVAVSTIVRIGGEALQGEIETIDKEGRVSGEGFPDDLMLNSLKEIRTGHELTDSAPNVIIHLAGGDLYADTVSIQDEVCSIKSTAGNFEFGIESIRGIRLKPKAKLATFDKALKNPLEAGDQIFIELDGQYQKLEGLIDSLTGNKLSLEYQGNPQSLPSGRVYGFVMAGFGDETERKINAEITLKNGSRLSGRIKSMNDGILLANVGILADIELPWSSITKITIRSDKLASLSELNPTDVEQQSLVVSVDRPWQRNRSISGNPLTLWQVSEETETVEQVFSSGLGTHSGCRLTFENFGEFNLFKATIGIDVETNRHGDCVFVVLGDGRELLSERRTGSDPGKPISVDISEVRNVTLLVEPGENLDLADHADWCEARFLKTDD